jgi:hypothetical protein
MKKTILLAVSMCVVSLATAVSVRAQVTISGSDFNNGALVGVYNGTYVSSPSGHENLAYTDPTDDAVVGAKGPFGVLTNLSMSFTYSNFVGTNGFGPYAAFGISDNGLWNGSGNEYLIIALSGNQINGSTPIHVFDEQTDAEYSPSLWGSTLDSILGTVPSESSDAFGDMQVMRAYAYIGDWPGIGNVSVDINSITVAPVPEPTTISLLVLAVGGLALLRKRK